MPRIVAGDVERFEVEPGEWYDLKRRVSVAERDRVRAAAFKAQTVIRATSAGVANDVEAPIDLGEALSGSRRMMVRIGLVAWSWPDAVTDEAIGTLEPETFDAIADRLDELWSPRSEQEKKASSLNGLTPSSVEALSPVASGGSR